MTDEPIYDYVARGTVERLTAERDVLLTERAAIIERLDGLSDDESLVDAVGFVVDEWNHYSREMNTAGYVTIPKLTAERDAALAQVARLRAALLALSGGGLSAPCWCGRLPHIPECDQAHAALGDGQGDAG